MVAKAMRSWSSVLREPRRGVERNEEVLKQQLSHCLEDAAAQQELVWARTLAASRKRSASKPA